VRLVKTRRADVFYNRTEDDFLQEEFSMGSMLGKERGERIRNVYDNDNIMSPLSSIEGEISNTAYIASTLDWREGQVMKWWNTFYDDFSTMPHIQAMKPEEALIHVYNSPVYAGDNHRLAVARNTAKFIVGQLNIKTDEEKAYLGIARRMSEKVEGVAGGQFNNIGAFMRQNNNWPMFVRNISFQTFMGAFNIKHLFMQGMNTFNAVAISPIHGLPASKTGLLYSIALASDNEDIWRNTARVNKITNLGLGMSEDEFVESVRMLRRSGIIDGLNHHTMWGAEGGKYGLFNRGRRVAGKLSAAPFTAGDGFSRIVSFDIARREFKEKNPGVAFWTDAAMREIISRQDDLTQNMTRANRANWQEGWKSIPFQFTQYQIKIAMNLVNSLSTGITNIGRARRGEPLRKYRAFTPMEASLLFMGHTLALGGAGWGVWNIGTALLPDEWVDENVTNMSEAERISLQQGIIAGAIYQMSGGEVSLGIGSTFGTFNYYADLWEGLTDPETTLVEALGGPGGFAIARWLGKAGYTIETINDRGITVESSKDMLTELATGFSSINNAFKAYIADSTNNYIRSNSGDNLYRVTDRELFFESIGIPSSKRFELDKVISDNRERQKEISKLGKEIGKYAMLQEAAISRGDAESMKMAQYYSNTIKGIINMPGFSVEERASLIRAWQKTDGWDRLTREQIKNMRSDLPPPNLISSKAYGE
jgi:hypothetical protein